MRVVLAAFGVILALAGGAMAFEVEDRLHLGPADAARHLTILSTTEAAIFAPVLEAFAARNPDLGLDYTVASTQETFRAIAEDGADFDLVLSSAMDLQMKLANDGFAQALPPELVAGRPGWARWRDLLVAVAQEPVVLVLAEGALAPGEAPPRTRRDLVALLRDNAERFRGRVGTYDPAISGAGYLFAAQDARLSDAFWRLAEVMGRLDAQLYCCTGIMVDQVRKGELLLAYNVLGSYAARGDGQGYHLIEMEDYTLTLLRSALVPSRAKSPDLAAAFLGFLLSPEGQALVTEGSGLPPVDAQAYARRPHLHPIRLDPGLLAPLDAASRARFLEEWRAAMVQP